MRASVDGLRNAEAVRSASVRRITCIPCWDRVEDEGGYILFDYLVLQLALVENVVFVGSHNKWDASTVFYAGAGT